MSTELHYMRDNSFFLTAWSRHPSSGVELFVPINWCIYCCSNWPETWNLKLILFFFPVGGTIFRAVKLFKVSGEIFLHVQCRVPKWNCLQGNSCMFQLIKYLKSNLRKADNQVHRGKRSGKISRIYVLNQIQNKKRLLYVTGIFL